MRFPFTFEIVDPSGNSFIQNPDAPNPDQFVKATNFMRTVDDYRTMGYNMDENTLAQQEEQLKQDGVIPMNEEAKKLTVKETAKAVKQTKNE